MIQYIYIYIYKVKGGFKMYKSLNSWIEYLHPKLGYPIIAKIEDEKKIRLQGNKIIKKVVNMECVYSEA